MVLVVVSADERDRAAAILPGAELVAGGSSRRESVANGLRHLADRGVGRVLVHDAARPFLPPAVIDRVLAALDQADGAVPVLPVADTLARGPDLLGDIVPRTEFPRPWLGGRWTLRDIVDYQMISTMALLETVAGLRETLLRQIYEVNRQTVETGRAGDPSAIVLQMDQQHDPREAAHLLDRLQIGGVEVYRADREFQAGGETFAPSVPKRSGRRPRSENAGLVSRNCTDTSGVSGSGSAAGSNHSDMSLQNRHQSACP